MKLLAEITAQSLGISGETERLGGEYELRKSARAVLLSADGNIALQHLTKYNFYKLPGGGIEDAETSEQAVLREVREEVGALARVLQPLGITIEYRNTLLHISYAYLLQVEGAINTPTLEIGEIEEGQETVWLPLPAAYDAIVSSVPQKYEGHFIIAREKAFLEEAMKTR